MKRKLNAKSLPIIMLIIGLVIGSAITIPAIAAQRARHKTNKNNQTYGVIDLSLSPDEMETPKLIAAVGIGGTEGYVYKSDLDGEQPQNPEEALEYMKNLDEEVQIAKRRRSGSEYLRYIPLYAADGETIIGQFGISYPDEFPED